MSTSVTMPALGESVTEGTVTRWLKQEGERVETDEPLLEVSTDKVDTEIPSPAAGMLSKIAVGEDETVEVGVELAVIDSADSANGAASEGAGGPGTATATEPHGEDQASVEEETVERTSQVEESTSQPQRPAAPPQPPAPARPAAQSAPPAPRTPAQPEPTQAEPTQAVAAGTPSADAAQSNGGTDDQGAYVTPLVRRLAAEQSVDLGSLTGTGVGGRIRKQDVLAAAQQAQPAPAAQAPSGRDAAQAGPVTPSADAQALRGRTEKMSRARSVIAQRMLSSLQTSAQLTTVVEADVTRIARLRQQVRGTFEAREGVKLSFLPFFALATLEALKAHPKLNAVIDTDAGTITYHDAEHLGVAVDTDRGLMVPVIHAAGDLNLGGLARKIADLADRTRANKVSPDELGGGTFTLTNTGSRGALFDTPVLNQPQVGILGTGTVVKRPVVVDDADLGEVISVRSIVYLALTYDHRLVDGADAARFLTTVKERLEGGTFEAQLGLG